MSPTTPVDSRTPPAAPPGVVLTKLNPPPERDQSISRSRLLERLRPTPGARLTVVAAPAGYGKSTVLGAFVAHEAPRPIGWVSIDAGDNDPVVLWSHVLEALRRAMPDLVFTISPQQVGASSVVDVLVSPLVNVLIGHGDAGLILDDFHRLSRGPARDSIAWFVDHIPPSFQLVISSRSDPPLSLAALRAHGDLVEVTADELAFTVDEAEALMNDRLGLDLTHDDIEDLVARIEGWPAGLYLAGLSLHGVEDPHAFIRRFDGSSRHVVDFLVDEVLDAHDPALQDLMLRSSILDRLSGPLCDAVLEQHGSGALLEGLSRTNLFLVPLDEHGHWYRFHHLFAQLLRVELEHRDPDVAQGLHQRAYVWHREQGLTDEAIRHALEAGAFGEAGQLIAAAWVEYMNDARYATVLAWLERLPADVLAGDAHLLAVKAWVLSMNARREEAIEARDAAEQLGDLDRGPLSDGFTSIAASLATLRAVLPWGDVSAMYASALRAAELERPGAPWWPVICWALGASLYFSGNLVEADRWFEESARLAPASEAWMAAYSALAYRSMLLGDLGDVEGQRPLAEQAAELAQDLGFEDVAGEVYVALGISLAARGRVDEAVPLLERGVEMLRAWGQPIDVVNALLHQVRVLQASGDHGAATDALAEAREIAEGCPDPGVLAERIRALELELQPARSRASTSLTVLRLLAGPLSERDIGRELWLSHNTIHSHTTSIYRKLGVSSRPAAVREARERRLIQ
jgi:LuxR family transcriptional regulator, maltose regulon positive regulatory protein